MKKHSYNNIIYFLLLLYFPSFSQLEKQLTIIPYPNYIQIKKDFFQIKPIINIYTKEKLESEITHFIKEIKGEGTFKVISAISKKNEYPSIELVITKPEKKEKINHEYYTLEITQNKIIVKAYHTSGIFYGLNTLSQLILSAKDNQIPCLLIKDEPNFKWRGMHLDVCRHFFSKEEIKKYLDLLASYKLNTFHWHLTEDQGWRIEIKKYPQLTKVGGFRNGTMVGAYKNQEFDTIKYGGYYTQEDIKEIVNYATSKHITIVPEIEMPGHALAAIASFPTLSCNKKPTDVAKGWGVFDDVYCAGNDSTFDFLFNVLDEVVELFPSKYIHIGGDECPKSRWKTCKNCQIRIKTEKLKDEHELQSYFIKRIEKYLNKKGKSIIGWDEILEGGLAENASVMSWRGEEGGIHAANKNHYVVMSPGAPCYFDHYQVSEIENEPLAIGGLNTLNAVYKYDPIPKKIDKGKEKYILGAQGNVWTEYILNYSQVEYMALPRMIALSEVLWTKKENKNYDYFVKRLLQHSEILDDKKINYCKHFKNKE